MEKDLSALIEGCRKGDPDSRASLYNRLSNKMFGVIRRYVRDYATAEDLLHDGFVILFTKIGEYRGEGNFEGWCRRIFVNVALGHLRRNMPELTEDYSDIPRSAAALPAGIEESINAADLMECVRRLPTGYGTILNLYAVEGYSHAEIAEQLGISENTSRSQYSRARVRLQEIVREYFDEKRN